MVANVYSRRPLHAEVVRTDSTASRMAVRGAVFAALLGAATLVTRRIGLVTYDELLAPLLVTAASAIVALGLALATLADCWLRGARGGWRALRAMALALLVLVPFSVAAQRFVTEPATADVTTDALDPPRITGTADEPFATPEQGRRFEASIERVAAAVETTLAELGWPVLEREGSLDVAEVDAAVPQPEAVEGDVPIPRMRPLTEEEQAAREQREAEERAVIAAERSAERREEEARLLYRAAVESPVLGVPSDIAIRLRDDGEATTLDLRARSREGRHDLGENRRRIAAFLAQLDETVQRDGVR